MRIDIVFIQMLNSYQGFYDFLTECVIVRFQLLA